MSGAITRRQWVKALALGVPMSGIVAGVDGYFSARADAKTPRIILRYDALPAALHGLSILQLSDVHLGACKNIRDLEALLGHFDDDARRPDLVLFTGDLADDVDQITDALNAASALRPRYGVFACLGNHEYLHGIGTTRPLYDRSQVRLLVDEGVRLSIGGASLWLAGVNDPIVIRGNIHPFLRAGLDRALDTAPRDAFSILLSHRPEGFDPASASGVNLTLSGHTHGGQIGFNGKSAFQPLYEDGYLWGSYARGASRLYTTSGFGHWFPFRLGCPTEAPLLVLDRA